MYKIKMRKLFYLTPLKTDTSIKLKSKFIKINNNSKTITIEP